MAKVKGNRQKHVGGAFGREQALSPIPTKKERREKRPFTELNKPQLDVFNRLCELQNGSLGIMSEASLAKRAKIQSKEAFEDALVAYKKKRGKMAPEEASDAQIQLSQFYKAKVKSREEHGFFTNIIIRINNTFLAAFGVDVRKKESEEHWQRKQRTREVVAQLIPEGYEIEAIAKFEELYKAALGKLIVAQEEQRKAEEEIEEEGEDFLEVEEIISVQKSLVGPNDSTLAVLAGSADEEEEENENEVEDEEKSEVLAGVVDEAESQAATATASE